LNFLITATTYTPWPQTCQATYVLCGQHASLHPADQVRHLLEALQKRLQIDASNPELAINEILASHALSSQILHFSSQLSSASKPSTTTWPGTIAKTYTLGAGFLPTQTIL